MQYHRLLDLPISGQFVRIRKLTSDDLPDLYEIEADPDVKRYLNGAVPDTRNVWIQKMQKLCPTSSTLAVIDIITDKLLGRASINGNPLKPFQPVVELEIVLGKSAWHRHLGREVANLLIVAATSNGASVVEAKVNPSHRASIALLNALGFSPDGVVESHGWDNGFLEYSRKSGA